MYVFVLDIYNRLCFNNRISERIWQSLDEKLECHVYIQICIDIIYDLHVCVLTFHPFWLTGLTKPQLKCMFVAMVWNNLPK